MFPIPTAVLYTATQGRPQEGGTKGSVVLDLGRVNWVLTALYVLSVGTFIFRAQTKLSATLWPPHTGGCHILTVPLHND